MKTFIIVAALAVLVCTVLTDDDASTEVPTTGVPTTEGTTTTPEDNPCSGLPDGTLLVDPYDCAKYYECLGGKVLELPCGQGTWWNEELKTCDYPANVNCTVTRTTTPATTAETTSTAA